MPPPSCPLHRHRQQQKSPSTATTWTKTLSTTRPWDNTLRQRDALPCLVALRRRRPLLCGRRRYCTHTARRNTVVSRVGCGRRVHTFCCGDANSDCERKRRWGGRITSMDADKIGGDVGASVEWGAVWLTQVGGFVDCRSL